MHRRPTATTPRLFAFGLIASAAAVVSASTASAATITWDGGAGTLNWLTPTNWSGDVLPGPGDDVVIDAAGAVTIALAGSATINSLTCADGLTVSAAGSLTVATTAQVNGVVTLSDGKLVGGSWTVPGGVVGIGSAVNRLDGLTLNGNASVGTNARLYLRNGLTLNGTLSLTGTNPRLVCENTMTIGGNATLQFDAGAFNPARLNIEGASTVTFGPSTLVEGGWAEFGASLSTPGTSTIVNKGTMRCDTGAASFQITGEGFVNEGTAEATAGTLSVLGGVAWSNTGLIRALTTGTVSLAGSVDPSDLGSIQNISGTVQLVAPLDLAGGTLALGPATGVWTLAGTTLSSGTLSVAPGFTPILTGDNTVLDAMTVVGTLSIGTNQRLWIRNGLTLDGVISMVASNPRLIVDGTQTIDGNATLQLDANPFNPARINLEGTSILTFATSVLVEGGWALIGQQLQTPGNSGVVNLGTIRCDTTNATFQILDESFTNGGSIEVTAGTLVIGSTTWSNTGTMQSLGGTLRLEGSTTLDSLDGITNGGGAVQSALSLNLAGQTWTIPASTGTVTFDGGTISNGVLTIESGASAAFTGSNSIFDAMTVNGPLTIGTNQRLWVRNGFVLNGTLTMNGSNPRLIVDGTQTISGNGTVNLAAASFNPARINVEGTSTVTFAPTILMEGGWAEFGQQLQTAGVSTIVNQGTMRCTVANAIYTIVGEGFTNAGTVEATSGTVSINPTTSWNNTGLIRALTGGSIALEGPTNLASLGDIRNVSGTVLLRSSLALAGGTLALNATTGPWTFDGCTLSGGTLDTGTVIPLFTGSNTIFNGMTVNGNLTIGTNQRLWTQNGLVLNGTLTMNGSNPRLVVNGTQTISGNGTVNLAAASFNPARVNVEGTSTVTFAPTILMEGGWAEFGQQLQTAGVSTIVNQGTMRCTVANAIYTIIGEGFTNAGTVEATSGTVSINPTTSWNNTGLIRALTGGSIALEGPTNLASLGDIRNVSGTVLVRSSLALAGGTLALNATTGPWTFDGCTLSGGTLSTGTILPLFTGSNTIFNGMTVNGNLTIGTNQRLIVKGGLTLNGAITMNGTNPRLVFDGTQTFGGNATVVLNAAAFNPARINVDGASTVTFAPSVLFEGGWAEFGNSLFTNGVSTIVNNGVLRCNQANATFTIAGESATNNGLIETISGTLVVENATNLAAGTLTGGVWKSTNGTLRFGTALDGLPITTLAAECSISGRTGKILNLSKLESIATTGILRLADGAVLTAVPASGTLVDNGFLFVSGISKLNVTGGFTHAPTAVITVATGAAGQIVVDASGPLTLDGVLQVSNGPGYTPVAGDQVIVTDGSSRVGTFATLTTCEASDLFYTPTQAVYVYGEDTGVFGDLNGDGFVGPADLALLLGSWGQCSDLCCQADLDLSGDVGPADIALLLGSWG